MARFDKFQVIALLQEAPVVPVFYDPDVETVCNVARACHAGGVRVFEFTNRGDFAHEVFARAVRELALSCPGLALGAGSVVDPATASLYIQCGASFVVGPMFNPEVAKVCNRRGIPYIPGCATATEVGAAQESGCDVCKVFPGDVAGPGFVKALKVPMPWSRLMVTGGVSPEAESLREWFGAGAFCVGIGSKLFPKERVREGDWEWIAGKCRETMTVVKEIRK